MPTLSVSGSDQTSLFQKQITALSADALARRSSMTLDIVDDLKISATIEYDPALVHIRSDGRRIDASGLPQGAPCLRAHRTSKIPELSNHGRTGGFVVFGPHILSNRDNGKGGGGVVLMRGGWIESRVGDQGPHTRQDARPPTATSSPSKPT
ncbi:hypothetical protein SAMN07250955_11742 [Arboricoccus pini]|uniref:Uncharacterized protein n=1 Tax=Arboricoccus pini TaxID=1963835 RepID=A0A212RYH1_9PROT|nr:hypothetical protein [Arboricoccus pini]SNB77803.1 hypothetical protein SAMN07250955_11742 [Arboricoccus pini]